MKNCPRPIPTHTPVCIAGLFYSTDTEHIPFVVAEPFCSALDSIGIFMLTAFFFFNPIWLYGLSQQQDHQTVEASESPNFVVATVNSDCSIHSFVHGHLDLPAVVLKLPWIKKMLIWSCFTFSVNLSHNSFFIPMLCCSYTHARKAVPEAAQLEAARIGGSSEAHMHRSTHGTWVGCHTTHSETAAEDW